MLCFLTTLLGFRTVKICRKYVNNSSHSIDLDTLTEIFGLIEKTDTIMFPVIGLAHPKY